MVTALAPPLLFLHSVGVGRVRSKGSGTANLLLLEAGCSRAGLVLLGCRLKAGATAWHGLRYLHCITSRRFDASISHRTGWGAPGGLV